MKQMTHKGYSNFNKQSQRNDWRLYNTKPSHYIALITPNVKRSLPETIAHARFPSQVRANRLRKHVHSARHKNIASRVGHLLREVTIQIRIKQLSRLIRALYCRKHQN